MIKKDMDSMINFLQGSGNNLSYAVEDFLNKDDMTMEECNYLDDHIMICGTCDWWVESHEIDEEGNCEECQQ